MKILSLGESLIDVVHSGDSTAEHVGGSILNVACGLGRLGHDSTLACWMGRDDRGRRIAEHVAASGATLHPGSDGAERTPVAYAELDAAGKASYTFELACDLPDLSDLDAYGHVHTGSIGATTEPGGTKVAAAARAASGATVSYDPNSRPALMGSPADVLGRVEDLVSLSDVVKASDEDLEWLYPDRAYLESAAAWLAMGPGLVVVTRGAAGAQALTADGAVHDVPPMDALVVDTVGAGDSFMAGLISGLADLGLLGSAEAAERLRAASWEELAPALRRAVTTSAITVSHAGAYGPTRDEVGPLLG